MTYEEYVAGVSEFLTEYLPAFIPKEAIGVAPVTQDGRAYYGLKILFPDEKTSNWEPLGMIINLQYCYQRVRHLPFGQALKETGEIVVETLKRQSRSRVHDITRILSDFAAAKDHLYVEIKNIKKEPEYLQKNIHKRIPGTEDLALVANLLLRLPDGAEGSYTLGKKELQEWGMTPEAVIAAACKNGMEQHGIRIEPVDERLPNLLELPTKEQCRDLQQTVFQKPFAVTNRDCFYGAATFFHPGVMEKMGDLIGDYSFSPVTTNHVAVVPVSFEKNQKPALLKNILQEIMVEFPGVTPLSNNIYCYNEKTKQIILASEYERLKKKAPQKVDTPNLYPKHKGQNPRL